jgi:conjugal transfer/entry exclusion protein
VGLLDIVFAPARAVLGAAERDIEHTLPVRDIERIQTRVLDTAEAIRRATESIETHIEVIERLANSIQPLYESVDRLTTQMSELNTVLGPLAGVERDAEKIEGFFHRHRHRDDEPPPARG